MLAPALSLVATGQLTQLSLEMQRSRSGTCHSIKEAAIQACLVWTHTMLGFWFDNPQDAGACGFNPMNPTLFNGEHRAGPNAMISAPDARTASIGQDRTR